MTHSPTRCIAVPTPDDEKVYLLGAAFARLTKSSNDLNSPVALERITNGYVATRLIQVKSSTGLNDSVFLIAAELECALVIKRMV